MREPMTFTEAYTVFSFDLLRHIRRGGSRDWSEDVFQDVMLQFSRYIDTLDTSDPIKVKRYLYKTADRIAADYARRDALAENDGVEEMAADDSDAFVEPFISRSRRGFFVLLPPASRRVILEFLDGMDATDIACNLRMTETTVRREISSAANIIKRARRAI